MDNDDLMLLLLLLLSETPRIYWKREDDRICSGGSPGFGRVVVVLNGLHIASLFRCATCNHLYLSRLAKARSGQLNGC